MTSLFLCNNMIYLYFFLLLTFLAKKLQNFAEIPCSAITQSRQFHCNYQKQNPGEKTKVLNYKQVRQLFLCETPSCEIPTYLPAPFNILRLRVSNMEQQEREWHSHTHVS